MMTSSRWAETLSWPHVFSSACTKSRMSRSRSPAFSRRRPSRRWLSISRHWSRPAKRPERSLSHCPRAPSKMELAPASIAQERLWKLQHALPDLPFFNVLYALRLTSACDVAVLERSINEIVRRHEILRTTFAVVDGRHVQVIAPQLTVPLAFDDLHALAELEEGDGATTNSFKKKCFIPSTSRKGPLIRARLVRLAEQEHLLLISMHQVIGDGWSLGVLRRRARHPLRRLRCRKGIAAGAAPDSVRRLCDWQRRWRSHPDIVAQLDYWREQLRDPLPVMRLAPARPKRTTRRFPHGAAKCGVAGQAFGGRQTLQPARRCHLVHDARRRLQDAVASLHG